MVPIIEAIVLHVMAQGGHDQGKGISIVEAGMFSQVLLSEDQINVLGNIWSVQIIVVLHGSLVLVVDLNDELQELVVINDL